MTLTIPKSSKTGSTEFFTFILASTDRISDYNTRCPYIFSLCIIAFSPLLSYKSSSIVTISIVFPFSLWLSPFLLPKNMLFVLLFNILFRVRFVYVLQLFDLCTLQIEPYFCLLNLFLMFIFIDCLYIILYWTVFLWVFFCFSFATSNISPVILLFFLASLLFQSSTVLQLWPTFSSWPLTSF